MLSRKEHQRKATILPDSWKEQVVHLLNATYSSECKRQNKEFKVYGASYPDELIVMVSFIDQKNSSVPPSPITYMASVDLTENQRTKKVLNSLLDSAGVFFDSVFSEENWSDYHPYWQKLELKDITFYFQTSRENVGLFLEGEKFLAHS